MISLRGIFLSKRLCSLRATVNINKTLASPAHRMSDIFKRYNSDKFGNNDQSTITSEEVSDEDRKKKLIEMEVAYLHERGHQAPNLDLIKPIHWTELLKCETKSARKRYYDYLFGIEKKIENKKIKKEVAAQSYQLFKEQHKDGMKCIWSRSTLFLRIGPKTMNKFRHSRLIRAMQLSEKLIFDCSYDQYMNRKEASAIARQLQYSFSQNRLSRDPYDIHFCNVDFTSNTFGALERLMPTIRNKEFPLHLHSGSYLDLFPKENLVYLTPHCQNDLTHYDPNAIYIIGAMVDGSNHQPLSLMKAKELGLKMARLPLDRYLNWRQSKKTLTLDQMMNIMLEIRNSGSWDKALQHVPRRKIYVPSRKIHAPVVPIKSNSNKFVERFREEQSAFASDNDFDKDGQSTLSLAEKFARKISTDDKWANNPRTNISSRNVARKRRFGGNPFSEEKVSERTQNLNPFSKEEVGGRIQNPFPKETANESNRNLFTEEKLTDLPDMEIFTGPNRNLEPHLYCKQVKYEDNEFLVCKEGYILVYAAAFQMRKDPKNVFYSVYYGIENPLNLSGPVRGIQTETHAQLVAVLRLIETLPKIESKKVSICLNCTRTIGTLRSLRIYNKNGYRSAKGEVLKMADTIGAIDKAIRLRNDIQFRFLYTPADVIHNMRQAKKLATSASY